jgi:hypothetical protein
LIERTSWTDGESDGYRLSVEIIGPVREWAWFLADRPGLRRYLTPDTEGGRALERHLDLGLELEAMAEAYLEERGSSWTAEKVADVARRIGEGTGTDPDLDAFAWGWDEMHHLKVTFDFDNDAFGGPAMPGLGLSFTPECWTWPRKATDVREDPVPGDMDELITLGLLEPEADTKEN